MIQTHRVEPLVEVGRQGGLEKVGGGALGCTPATRIPRSRLSVTIVLFSQGRATSLLARSFRFSRHPLPPRLLLHAVFHLFVVVAVNDN